MPVQYMTKRDEIQPGYHHEETIPDGVTGDWIIIPAMVMNCGTIQCFISTGAGSGKFQFTGSGKEKIMAGTAYARDWPLGNVTGDDEDSVAQVMAIRGVSISGDIDIEVVI